MLTPSQPRTGTDYLIDVVQRLSLARDLDSVVRIVRTAARELTGADGATVVLRDNGKCYYVEEDAISPLWKGLRFPMETCISGWTMLNKQAVAIEDIYQDPRIPHDAYRPTFVKSLAMVPIRTIDPIGAIGNYWASHHVATPEELKLLQSLADIAAVTFENVTLYSELEQRVKDRTAELQEANKSLEAYSHSISHDLRSPLRTIKGFVNILMEDLVEDLGEDAIRNHQHTVNRINNGVDRMDSLIEGLLSFAQLGKRKVVTSQVSMQQMVAELVEGVKGENPSRVFEFTIGELPDIEADSVLIRQVWTNLLSNAAKYSGKRDVSVITVGSTEEEERIIYFVKDNGAGFDITSAEKLFGIFQRMHSVREFEGIGIGLSLARSIVEKHGGKIWAEAKVEEGATFYFSLPKGSDL